MPYKIVIVILVAVIGFLVTNSRFNYSLSNYGTKVPENVEAR